MPADHDLLWWWSSSKHDLHLEATNYRLKELGLQTLQAAVSVSDPDTVTALFAQFTECAYRSFELEERWLNASADTSRESHAREHTRLIGLLTELYMKMMDDDLHPCASIRHLLEDEFLPHIGASDRALLYRLAHGSDEDIERDDPPGAN
ncbi:hemerythrin domain-containing protein [Zoogloea dura]|uniref:Hemerythrin-like domain-containing protein n=1 Tax=Zoogloea dura TaxID=2728840 RepID=A0A848GCI9_9RHOO|nr:hypothetical protein [Zoogloea dura]NML29100.1 hypothetical protein [Zoogloea dura]